MKELLKKLNISCKNEELYQKALTHSSFAYENQTEKNERLEFLGDSVIGLLMSEYLFREDTSNEGEMSKTRAKAVCEEALVVYAEKINLKKYLKLGRGELQKGANISMIADAYEALFGAIYLDLGFDAARQVFKKMIVPNLPLVLEDKDYKSLLQEYIQSGDKRNISYHTIKETGPSHDKEFEVVVKLDKEIILGIGRGKKKRDAEQSAAHDALKKGNYDLKETV
ncbi:MAG: ribonuclease III [Acholeplasmataceae bacterium]|nr:ribonuclease III [Acholeplasmataceae bacterium]